MGQQSQVELCLQMAGCREENKGQRREGKIRQWVQERKGFGQKHRWEKESG